MDNMDKLVQKLADHLGRTPTEYEIYYFVFGTKEQSNEIWNRGDYAKPE